MKPNAEDNGIVGIQEATVKAVFSDEAWKYIHTLFPTLSGTNDKKTYDMESSKLHFVQSEDAALKVELKAKTTNPVLSGSSFEIENVEVTTR